MLRTNQKPSYAIIREWLIAGVALRKDCRQRQLWDSLKNLKFKLHWIWFVCDWRTGLWVAGKKTSKLETRPLKQLSLA